MSSLEEIDIFPLQTRGICKNLRPLKRGTMTHIQSEYRTEPKFSLGRVVATPGALRTLDEAGQNPLDLLFKHQTGDWGEICEEDKKENEFSLKNGYRLLSAYTIGNGRKIWIITERDRSATTILLPEEY